VKPKSTKGKDGEIKPKTEHEGGSEAEPAAKPKLWNDQSKVQTATKKADPDPSATVADA
jgi:cytochrome c556